MTQVRVQSLKNQSLIADKCNVADRFFGRLIGLIGTSRLESGEGLLISPCREIHMWFMSIPIDVVFVRSEKSQPQGGLQGSDKTTHVVCSVHEGLRPWKALPVGDRSARETLELPIGTIQRCAIAPGDRLCIS